MTIVGNLKSMVLGKWIVIDKATGVPIGDAGLMLEGCKGEAHVGYKIARSHWGQGLATEAAREWATHGFKRAVGGRIQVIRRRADDRSNHRRRSRLIRKDSGSGLPVPRACHKAGPSTPNTV